MVKRKINGAAVLVLAFVLMFSGIYNAHERWRLRRDCTETTWGEVASARYHSGWRADVRFSVSGMVYGFDTGTSIRRIDEENLIVRYNPNDPHDCYSQDYPPPSGLLKIFIAAVFAVMGVLEIRKKTTQE